MCCPFFSGESWPWNQRGNQKKPHNNYFCLLWRSPNENLHFDEEGLLYKISEICLLQRTGRTSNQPQNRQACAHLNQPIVNVQNCAGEQRHRVWGRRGWGLRGRCSERLSVGAWPGILSSPGSLGPHMLPCTQKLMEKSSSLSTEKGGYEGREQEFVWKGLHKEEESRRQEQQDRYLGSLIPSETVQHLLLHTVCLHIHLHVPA